MDTISSIDILLAIILVITNLGTALGTFVTARNQTKQVDADAEYKDKTLQVETTDKVIKMSLDLAKELKEQLKDCNDKKEQLERKLSKIATKKTENTLRLHVIITNLRKIIDRHNEIADKNCPGYSVINNMVIDLIDELEKELSEDNEVKE